MSDPIRTALDRWLAYATPAERAELADIDARRKSIDAERQDLTDRWRRLTQRLACRERDARRKVRAA
jgi:hypothetical protein